MRLRVGLGYDVHPFGGSGSLVLGGVTIDHARLAGHSDADVVAHAVTDAILGAAGLPDLGAMFPASDPQWKDASSIHFLEVAAERVAVAGWWVENVDVVVTAEAPRLSPHLEAMAANLTTALDEARGPTGEPVFVAIKPKRGEGIGAIGRSEGIAAWAVALLQR